MQTGLWQGPVVDAHHHVWDPIENRYPWLEPGVQIPHRYGDYEAIKLRYQPEDFLNRPGFRGGCLVTEP